MKTSPAQPRLVLWKKALFAAFTLVLSLGFSELVLLLAGVRPAGANRDPFVGFEPGVPLFVRDGEAYVTNEAKLSFFNAQTFPATKPPGTHRVFCLGGSTTYGHPYDARTAYPAWLQAWLDALAGDGSWDVINCGGISYASYRLALLSDELARYEPDMFIVYTGHNEFLEERTYGDVRDWSGGFRTTISLASRLRTYAMLESLLRGSRQPADAPVSSLAAEVDTILENPNGPQKYRRDDALRTQVEEHFRFSLTRLIETARQAGAKVILVSPASNLLDFSPFKSEHEGLDAQPEALADWQADFTDGVARLDAGEAAAATVPLEKAAALAPRHAETLYRLGRALVDASRFDDGLAKLVDARDEDVCPLRASTRLQEIVREVGSQFDVPVIDYPAMLASIARQQLGHDAVGDESFLDHVHPTITAHGLLGIQLYDALRKLDDTLPARPAEADVAASVWKAVQSQLTPVDHVDALVNVAMTLAWAGKDAEALQACDKALEAMPDHVGAARMRGRLLQKLGRNDEALAQLEAAAEAAPNSSEVLAPLADEYGRRGEYELARATLQRAIDNTPERAPASFRAMLHRQMALCCRLLGDEPVATEHQTRADELGRTGR